MLLEYVAQALQVGGHLMLVQFVEECIGSSELQHIRPAHLHDADPPACARASLPLSESSSQPSELANGWTIIMPGGYRDYEINLCSHLA